MNIKPISNNDYSYNNRGLEGKKGKETASESKIEDKVEISEQAKVMNKENLQSKKLALIKDRINNNFYNSDEVAKKVAQELYKDLKAQ
ncbi:MAG: hypothetical protein WAM24_20390 [Ignavibacteriaceae bacterium]